MEFPQDRKRNMENLDQIKDLLEVLVEKTDETNVILRDIRMHLSGVFQN